MSTPKRGEIREIVGVGGDRGKQYASSNRAKGFAVGDWVVVLRPTDEERDVWMCQGVPLGEEYHFNVDELGPAKGRINGITEEAPSECDT